METGCEPALLLRQPKRFRHVCPLLKPDGQGAWRCSVNTPEVRPFWGRVVALLGLGSVAAYVCLTLTAWAVLQARGYPISYAGVAWPPAWSRFHHVQSDYFAGRAQAALERKDVPEALMAFSIAFEKNPRNYALGRTFARLAQGAQPVLADRVFARLLQEHADQRPQTLAAWYESLLWRGDFATIRTVARQGIVLDPAGSAPWVNALLFALRREPSPGVLQELATDTALGGARVVFDLELRALRSPAEARQLLLAADPSAHPYVQYYRLMRLVETGHAQDALTVMERSAHSLSARDLVTLRLEVYRALGWSGVLQTNIDGLLSTAVSATTAEVIAAFLVRHPDAVLLRRAFDLYTEGHTSTGEEAYRGWTAWLCAAGAVRDFDTFNRASAEMKKIAGGDIRVLQHVEAFFRAGGTQSRVENYVPALQPLPLEVTYALLERYYAPRSPAKQPSP